jgi:hypothetical protein
VAGDAHHVQLRLRGDDAEPALWHKENLLNLGARALPEGWRAVAFVDLETVFLNPKWAEETFRLLTDGSADFVQPFEKINGVATSVAWEMAQEGFAPPKDLLTWLATHSRGTLGYPMAMNRGTFMRLGGLFELQGAANDIVVGAALTLQEYATLFWPWGSAPAMLSQDAFDAIFKYVSSAHAVQPRPRFVAGNVVHPGQASLRDKQYGSDFEWAKIVEPSKHLTHRDDGVLVPTAAMPAAVIQGFRAFYEGRQ